jgi:hypothetical protein
VKVIVDCVQPPVDDTVCDPAAGTCGFFLAAYDYVARHQGKTLDKDQKKHLECKHVDRLATREGVCRCDAFPDEIPDPMITEIQQTLSGIIGLYLDGGVPGAGHQGLDDGRHQDRDRRGADI